MYRLGYEQHHRGGCDPEHDERPERKCRLPRTHMWARIQTKRPKIAERHELGHADANAHSGSEREHPKDTRDHPSRVRWNWRADDPRNRKQARCRACADECAHPPGEARLCERLTREVKTGGPTAPGVHRRRASRLGQERHPISDGNPNRDRGQFRDRGNRVPHTSECYCADFPAAGRGGRDRVVTIGALSRGMLRP